MSEPQSAPGGAISFLVHDVGDDVAVAVADTDPGEVGGAYLKTGERFPVTVGEQVPLGHKVALRDLAEGAKVTEYGVVIGVTRRPVSVGQLVHTHNLRSARWQSSL